MQKKDYRTTMEHSIDTLNVESDFQNESNANSTARLVEQSTQNSTDFSHRFDSGNKQSAGTCNDEVKIVTATTPINKKLTAPLAIQTLHPTKNSIIYFDDFNNTTTIRSPISELSFNIARAKLASTCEVMGKCGFLTGTLRSDERKKQTMRHNIH